MKPAHQNILTYTVLLLILILGYQNCAPVAEGVQPPGEVRTEPLADFKLSFYADEIQTSMTSDIFGACGQEQEGATLRWWAEDVYGELVTAGKAHCFEGEFAILLEDMGALSCLEDYTLHIQLGARAHHQAKLLVDCE